jgi:Ca2+:H+ antiporter
MRFHQRLPNDTMTMLMLAVFIIVTLGIASSGHDPAGRHARAISAIASVGLLAVSGGGAAFVSEWFIDALAPAIDQLGISREFAGLVIVAIAGNAVENVTALLLAAKGESDLAISVVKNSVAQIAVFLFPVLIPVSLLFATPLTFVLPPVYIASLALGGTGDLADHRRRGGARL